MRSHYNLNNKHKKKELMISNQIVMNSRADCVTIKKPFRLYKPQWIIK